MGSVRETPSSLTSRPPVRREASRRASCLVFEHDSQLGSAPSHTLLESVAIQRRDGVEVPRAFSDYEIDIGATPDGVTPIDRL